MSMVRVRAVVPAALSSPVTSIFLDCPGAVGIQLTTLADLDRDGGRLAGVMADVARESVDRLLESLRALGVHDDGMVTLEPVETAVGALARRAQDRAPGEGDDALIWDELAARIGDDSTLTLTFLGFMVLATLLAAIGVVTDSTITVVGACVVGPEFAPLAALGLGLVRRRINVARRAALALVVGFTTAIVATALLTLLARGVGLIRAGDLGGDRATDFIYHPGWFSIITALVAGAAGMLSLTSARSAALVGVFISVTTIPAAGNAAVAAVLGQWYEFGQSLLQLGINMVGVTAAGVLTLLLRQSGWWRRA